MTDGTAVKMNKKVLIVDDDTDMVLFLHTLMAGHGYQPITAKSCSEGMCKACDKGLCCIILNAMMSGEEGLSLYIDIKSDPRIRDIPVVMLCNLPRKTFLQYRKFKSAQHRGVPEPEAFLESPADADSLLKTVDELVGGRA